MHSVKEAGFDSVTCLLQVYDIKTNVIFTHIQEPYQILGMSLIFNAITKPL
jgi:hypothetical protein